MKRPTITQQIRAARAPSGSALEKMIRDNQDFEILAPEELDDDYPIPLWLRVAYRKQHREIQFPSKNPGAAYPEVLSQVYKRMVASPSDVWGGMEPTESPDKSERDD